MIYITGDIHGDIGRIKRITEEYQTTKDDILIIVGDVGLNYYGDSSDKINKRKVQQMPITLFCVHGNHEMRPRNIESYDVRSWKGGIVWYEKEFPDILFAEDGEIFNLDGKKTLVIGGAYSVDKWYRLENGHKWFEDEQPSDAIKQYAEKQLQDVDWKVDCVLTHTSPLKYEPVEMFLGFIDQSTVDKSTETWLDSIEDRLDYKRWYFGHYHGYKRIDKIIMLFEEVIEFGRY